MRRQGWLVFAAWVLAGALAVFSLLGAASIGFFIAPLAAVAIWLAFRFGRAVPEMLGMVSGTGAVCLLIAFLNRGMTPCTEQGHTLSPGETEATCGGLAPTPWLIAGLVLVAVGIVAYALARRGTDSGGGRQPLRLDAEGTSTVPDRG
jgi:hypothetical protein